MNSHETRKQHTYIRVRDFGIEHATDFAPNSLATQLFATIGEIVDGIDRHAVAEFAKGSSSRQGTTSRVEARERLRDMVEAIRRTSRPLARTVPGLDDQFSVPASNRDQDLLNAARAIVDAAVPLASQFIARELPADFLDELRARIAALQTAMSHQSESIGQRVAARAGIDMMIAKGIETVTDLDPIVKNRYENNPDILAQWTSVKHTEQGPRRSRSTVVTTNSPATVPQPGPSPNGVSSPSSAPLSSGGLPAA